MKKRINKKSIEQRFLKWLSSRVVKFGKGGVSMVKNTRLQRIARMKRKQSIVRFFKRIHKNFVDIFYLASVETRNLLAWDKIRTYFSESARSTRKLQKLKYQIIQKEFPTRFIKRKNKSLVWRKMFVEIKSKFKPAKHKLKFAVASLVLVAIVLVLVFPNQKTQGATYYFPQTNWSSQTTNQTGHPAPADWTQYSSKDSSMGTGATLTATPQNYTATDDKTLSTTGLATGGGFDGATKVDTIVNGSDNATGNVSLAQSQLKINEYTIGKMSDVLVNVTNVGAPSNGTWLLTLSGTPNLSRVFKNDKFVDSAGKAWKVLSLNPSTTTPRLLVWDSEGNGGNPATGSGAGVHVGRWYTSIATWEAGRRGDLVEKNVIERGLPYMENGGANDTDSVTFSQVNWVVDANHYPEIFVPFSERHRGKWSNNAYTKQSPSDGIDIGLNYFRMDGMQFLQGGVGVARMAIRIRYQVDGGSDIRISNNIIDGQNATDSVGIYIQNSAYALVKIWNNIIYNCGRAGNGGFYISVNPLAGSFAYNNTIYGNNGGIYGGSNVVYKNNLVYNNTDNYNGTFNAASANNLSGPGTDAQMPATNKRDGVTVKFVDAANSDFHLAFNDTGAKDQGANLSTDTALPATDIDGDDRTTTLADIGADDVGAVYVHANSIGTASRDFSTLQAWEDARDGVLTTRQVFKITSQSGAFTAGETITGGTSGKTGTYIAERATPSASEIYMTLDSASGAFTTGETLTGGTSGKTAILSEIITSSGAIEKGEVYNDATFTSGITIAGSTIDANKYMWLTAEPRSRHRGITGTGVSIAANTYASIYYQDDYSKLEWLSIDKTGMNSNGFVPYGDRKGVVIRNNLVYKGSGTNYQTADGISVSCNGTGNSALIYNNVVSGFAQGITVCGNLDKAYNNTVINSITGFYRTGADATVTIKNNIAINNTTGYGSGWGTSSNNISSDATASGTGSQTNKNLADLKFVSTDASLMDLHLLANSTASVAKNTGTDLSATFKQDIDQQARVGTWDVGADELEQTEVFYKKTGLFESTTIDLGLKSSLPSVTWNPTAQAAGTTMRIQIAANNDNASWNYIGPDGTAGTYFTVSGTATPIALNGNRYVKYKAFLSTTDTTQTATLNDVTINYSQIPTTSTLTSSVFDSSDPTNILANVNLKGYLGTAGTAIKMQLRSSPNGSDSWTSWCGPDVCDDNDVFDFTSPNSSPGQTIDLAEGHALKSGADDRYFQYKVIMNSQGDFTPTIESVSVTYVVNAAPEFESVNVAQLTDADADTVNRGKIKIDYSIRDVDTDTGSFSTNYVTPTFEYTVDGTNYLPIDVNRISFGSAPYSACGSSQCNNNNFSDGGAYWMYNGSVTNRVLKDNFSNYSVYWDAKTQIPETYSANFKVRVRINDNESANNTATASSAQGSVDTKNPTNCAFHIDHNANQLIFAGPADNSVLQLSASNVAGTFSTFDSFVSPYTYNNLTADPATAYVRVKDLYGNYTDVSATTPGKPSSPVYFDTSNPAQGTFQEFISWNVLSTSQSGSGFASYKVYRKVDAGNFELQTTIADRNNNYYLDKIKDTDNNTVDSDPAFNPDAPSSYTYKIIATDTNGNISAYSDTVTDTPNGTGGSDSTPPTISDVTISNINTTSAVINWNTDELSSSYVGYSTQSECDAAPGGVCPYLTERGLASMVTNHEIILTNLDSNTTYNLRIKSYDAMGNKGENDKDAPGNNAVPDFTFQTLAGPEISSVVVDSSNTQAIVSWVTTTNSDSFVIFSDAVSDTGELVNPASVGTPNLVGGSGFFNHAQTLSLYDGNPLIPGTTYYFYVTSKDISNITAIDDNGGNFYSFSTTQDDDAPVVSNVNAAIINDTQVAINWTTDESADSQVRYKDDSETYSDNPTEVISTYDKSHFVVISGLDPGTEYSYQVMSKDINENQSDSIESVFTTQKDPEFQHDPLSKIEDINIPTEIISDTHAVVNFNTDQPAVCYAKLTTAQGSYANSAIVQENGFVQNKYSLMHTISFIDLIPTTDHYFYLYCHDNLFDTGDSLEISSDSELQFKTSEKLYTEAGAGMLGDKVAPVISSIGTTDVTGESVTVNWSTDEVANSLVKFGIVSGTYENYGGDSLVNDLVANYATAHTVIVNNLSPGTKYFYKVISYDAVGNFDESEEQTFTTSSASNLSSISLTSTKLGEITIAWKSSTKTTSIIEYGATEIYGEIKQSNTLTQEHLVVISGLQQNTEYYFIVKGKDILNNLYSSQGLKFTPKSPPIISGGSVSGVTEHSAVIKFNTNIPTDALITFTGENSSGSQGKPDLAVTHEIELSNIAQGTTYTTTIKARDIDGNEITLAGPSFTTGKDENPPKIDQVRTDSALAQNDKVQTIISWTTDESATTEIIYQEGRNAEKKSIKVSNVLTASHVAVITTFKSGVVYYFQVKSIDQSGNEASSNDYALLTPKRKENVIQIIINNFQDIFSWTK